MFPYKKKKNNKRTNGKCKICLKRPKLKFSLSERKKEQEKKKKRRNCSRLDSETQQYISWVSFSRINSSSTSSRSVRHCGAEDNWAQLPGPLLAKQAAASSNQCNIVANARQKHHQAVSVTAKQHHKMCLGNSAQTTFIPITCGKLGPPAPMGNKVF